MIRKFKVGRYYRIKDRGIFLVVNLIPYSNTSLTEISFKYITGKDAFLAQSRWITKTWLSLATEIKKKDLVLEILKESE